MRSLSVAVFLLLASASHAQGIANPCPGAQPVPAQLRLPAAMPAGEPVELEKRMLAYLSTLDYRNLGWCKDKWVRDTGPYIGTNGYIVHPPVHIYYSPGVSNWLLNGRHGDIPDGAVIIKEQFAPAPAARYRDIPLKDLGCSNDWTIMIRNSKASLDGWFWAELWNGSMNFNNPYQYPNAGYGLYCLRCHASAESDLTFSALNNVQGAPGWPLQYRVDNSWRITPASIPPKACGQGIGLIDYLEITSKLTAAKSPQRREEAISPLDFPSHEKNAALEEDVKALHLASISIPASIQEMPPETFDDVLAPPKSTPPGNSPEFVSSSQCLACHSGLTGSSVGPTMVLTSKTTPSTTVNVSPYGEWRWSPMGLAGRDPVFYSQLDSEIAPLGPHAEKQRVIDICMTCHGAMGKRAFAAEHPGEDFKVDFVYDTDPRTVGFKYGGLARDGISCEICHRMEAPKNSSLSYFLEHHINGVFDLTPPGELHGPFKDNEITTYQMLTGLNVKPTYNSYIQSAQMCGTCHTIVLPVLDSDKPGETSVEQDTYVEWLNSAYRDEYGSVGATPKTCQDCHMPSGDVNPRAQIDVPTIQDRMAIVEDLTYPVTDHLATPSDLNVRYRETGYVRHELLGMNGFLLEMFMHPLDQNQNNEILGVRLSDYMTGLTTDLQDASDNLVQQARTITATVAISKWEIEKDKLIVEVTVTNKTGHRFPSGVGFRRAFLDLQATMNGKPFFNSGATNQMGEIVDFAGHVLPTEFFEDGQYQPHFDRTNPIRRSDQVQIYEELIQDHDHHFTTGFTRRDYNIKDNRLLPIGWSLHGPPGLEIPEEFLEATRPVGRALHDPIYLAGKGESIVRYEIPLPQCANAGNIHAQVGLYSQTMPPYFLAERYRTKTPATARLEYLKNNLDTLSGTDYAGWKLLIASAARRRLRKRR
ncbi:MAG: hypothetical protein ACRD3N_02710 [Terracidiphilus sp.]